MATLRCKADEHLIVTEFPRALREIEHTLIPLRDGTNLAARIWLPADDAHQNRVPAILEYLPYRKRTGTYDRDALTHPYLAGHGYACVRVDIRGSGESDGLLFDEYARQEQDDAGPAHLMPSLGAGREADDVTGAQLALVPLSPQRRRPVHDDQPFLHPVVEVVGERALALVEVVEADADALRAELPPDPRRPPAEALPRLAVAPVFRARLEDVYPQHAKTIIGMKTQLHSTSSLIYVAA